MANWQFRNGDDWGMAAVESSRNEQVRSSAILARTFLAGGGGVRVIESKE